MLKQRVLTAACLMPPVIAAILFLPLSVITLVFATFVLIGAWEWARLAGWQGTGQRLAYTALLAVLLAGLYWLRQQTDTSAVVLWFSVAWWLVALLQVVIYQRQGKPTLRHPLMLGITGIAILLPVWLALIALHGLAPYVTLLILCLIWAADIAAYFAGRAWGKQKLASRVSPGKSREGVYGALVSAVVMGLLFLQTPVLSGLPVVLFLLLCVITVMVSVLGDLYESLYKRIAGLKDSGNILPGHGGVLDRIDSLTAAAPFFALGIQLLGGSL